ncbi:type IV secretion protein Rhs [Psychrobacter aestuarii]|uniref:Type IV secretion protein Rhs n=1 Tax=Psychrobacter aestuarii TaxID=556327 RepID=A0ABN0W2V4_9GAMM|nr:type IV secretion protein Rhs [Psychrobacter aestuarii]
MLKERLRIARISDALTLRARHHAWRYPQSRALSAGERALAQSVFGDALQLDDIRLKTTWWVLKNYAVSPNGNIYFHPDDWTVDFSKKPLLTQSWLIHELTHVWQYQHGIKVIRGALRSRRYSYQLLPNKPFLSYGVEQQARMVQDYFILSKRKQNCDALRACIPFLNTNIDT